MIPPAEHREKRWHWLQFTDQLGTVYEPIPKLWNGMGWTHYQGTFSSDDMTRMGWCYYAPCIPPTTPYTAPP